MLSRRTLIGSTAVLVAGCGGLDIPFPELGPPKIRPLTWVSRPIPESQYRPRYRVIRGKAPKDGAESGG